MTHEQLRHQHYENLGKYRSLPEYHAYAHQIGWPESYVEASYERRWEIDAEIYDEALGMLPPLKFDGTSFFVSEFLFANMTCKYSKVGDRYFCEFARFESRHQRRH